jgi:hypothetical protein
MALNINNTVLPMTGAEKIKTETIKIPTKAYSITVTPFCDLMVTCFFIAICIAKMATLKKRNMLGITFPPEKIIGSSWTIADKKVNLVELTALQCKRYIGASVYYKHS